MKTNRLVIIKINGVTRYNSTINSNFIVTIVVVTATEVSLLLLTT